MMSLIRPRTCSLSVLFFRLNNRVAVPIHSVPSEAPRSEYTSALNGVCCPGGVHGTNRTPSYLTSPAPVPIQM